MLTLAQANASARFPNSVISAQTATPTTHAVRKQPRRNVASASQPGWSTRKSNAHQPSAASSTNTARLRTIPTIQDPSVRWRMPIGARNWCLSDLDQTSSRTAYATSSWQTLTTESAIVPTSTNDACACVSSRNRDIRPIDSTPTIGQKSSSKKKNTLRAPMRAFRSVTAQTASSSLRQRTDDLLELGLAHVVGRQHDRDPLLAAQAGDVRAHPRGHVGVQTQRGLVEKEQLGLVDERLGQRHALLEPGRQVRIRDAAVWHQLAQLDQRV